MYDKMRVEQDDYREWLLSQPQHEILNHAYEYSVREDILATMSEGHLPPMLAKALLESEQPLASVYADWRKSDYGIYEELIEVIQERAKKELQQSPKFMEICIFQVDHDRDQNRVAYLSMEKLAKFQGDSRVDSGIYNSVFQGVVECSTLEGVYYMFNVNHPDGYTGRSLSVSDVVQVISSSAVEHGFYFCESIGFQKIDFEPEKTHDMTNAIPVLLLEPGRVAKPTLVNNTLADIQQLIGGNIEAISLPDGGTLLCNEEGKFLSLPQNRAIKDDRGKVLDVLVGTCLICGTKDGDFTGLTPDQMKHYKKEFQHPQKIFQRNGEVVAKDIKLHDMER
nr:DUF3848 domain-containing protein [Intestinimonas butyriciproducens]